MCRTFGLSRVAYHEARRSDKVIPIDRARKTPSTVLLVSDEVLEDRIRARADEFQAFGVRRIMPS